MFKVTYKLHYVGSLHLFPKAALDESGINGTVQITVKNKVIMISAVENKRKKTCANFKHAKKEIADSVVNRFDATEWTW